MEKIKENSAKLKTEILAKVETGVKIFINRANQCKIKQQKEFSQELENLNEEIEKIKEIIERDEAVISYIKSQLSYNGNDKENSVYKQKNLYNNVISTREYAERVNRRLRLYEKRLGLSLKKLESNTLWIAFQCISKNDREYSAILRVGSVGYELLKCTPEVLNIQELIKNLNSDKNFSKFLKELRNSFKDFCDKN